MGNFVNDSHLSSSDKIVASAIWGRAQQAKGIVRYVNCVFVILNFKLLSD